MHRPDLRGYAASILVIGLASGFSWQVFGEGQLADVVMVLLLGIVMVAMRFGYGPSVFAAILGVLSFDFFFVPPYFTLAVSDLRHILTFAVMFLVAIIISSLTQRIRAQATAARERESRTASLYAMSRELAASASSAAIYEVAARHVAHVFECQVAVLMRRPDLDALTMAGAGNLTFTPTEKDLTVAEWTWAHRQNAGLGTDTLPSADALYVPLQGGGACVGVLGLRPADRERVQGPEEEQLLAAFTGQIATAIERATLAHAAQRAQVQVETEQLKNSLLSSVSHDLRTPLAVITGSAATLVDGGIDDATRLELLATIEEEGNRLNLLVQNLLDMTRLEGGALVVKKEWQDVEEVIGSALTRLESRLGSRVVETRVPRDLGMAPFDAILLEQVLINLIENAIKYTPADSPLEVSARRTAEAVLVSVSDRGPGVKAADAEKVFEKFYRATEGKGGTGLGLTICRGIVVAHGGRLWVDARDGGGAAFRFTIPCEGSPPTPTMTEDLDDASDTTEHP